MSAKGSSSPAWFRLLAISGFCVAAALSLPLATHAADSDKPGEGAKAEQSPEEAAGGRANLLRIKKACEEDVKRLCADIRPGGGRLLQCLRGKPDNLTPACRQVMDSRSGNR